MEVHFNQMFARHCHDLGMTVLALDDLSGGFAANVPQGVTFIEGAASDFANRFVEHSRNTKKSH